MSFHWKHNLENRDFIIINELLSKIFRVNCYFKMSERLKIEFFFKTDLLYFYSLSDILLQRI